MKVIIVGAGKLGYKLAQALINAKVDVTLVDSNPKVIDRANDQLDVLTVVANGIEVDTLRSLSIHTYDLLVAATNHDETNTIICSLAKKLGCKKTIARIRNPEYVKQLDFIKTEMGIDHIVNPDFSVANEIVRYLLKSYHFYSSNFAKGKVSMMDYNIGSNEKLAGKKIHELKELGNILITAISRNGEVIIPNGQTKLLENDTIYVVGKSDIISNLSEKFKIKTTSKAVKRVMILGGGKIGYYLALKFNAANVNVKIIESNKERCEYLSEKLDGSLIIHGDGTDINLLEEESLTSMDAFISATGYDEQNLLMALMAKRAGVNKVIAKISKQNYIHIIDKLGIDVAINPIDITAGDILKFIRGGKVVSVSLLLGGQAEVTEIIAGNNLGILDKPIKKLDLPKGVIIGAIVRNDEVIIPNGETEIKLNDRLIIFCIVSDIPYLDIFTKHQHGGGLSELWNRNKGIR